MSKLVEAIIEPFLTTETIKKVGDKYVVYPKSGGDRLGTHDTKEKALAQLRAIEASKNENLEEQKKIKKVIFCYGGRFQPFGPHHKGVYDYLVKKFGKDSVYITTSGIMKFPRHPMSFKEKVTHMVKMGVPKNRIVQERTPYIAANALDKYDPETTAVVYIFGAKDAGRLTSEKYFEDYKKNKGNLKGYKDVGYILTAPHVSVRVRGKEVSGTVMRQLLGSSKIDDDVRKKLFKQAFGYFNEKIFNIMVNKFKKIVESIGTGYPDEEDMKKIKKRVKKERNRTDSNEKYQYHPINEAKVHQSAGIIPFIRENNEIKLLLLKNNYGWGFPKGHLEENEKALEAAFRETREETGLKIKKVLPGFKHISKYLVKVDYEAGEKLDKPEMKFVLYFLGESPTKNVKLSFEHSAYKWVTAKEAKKLVKFADTKKAIDKVMSVLQKTEDINIPINVGDVILGGRFKNKKITVKSISWNEKGDALINGKPLMKYRLITKENIAEFIGRIGEETILELIREISYGVYGASGIVDDGPRYWWGNQKSYRINTEKEAAKLGWDVVDYIVPEEEFPEHDTGYPKGPTGTVTYFPAGKVGTKAGTGIMADKRGNEAWMLWAKNVNRAIEQLGFELVDYLGADNSITDTKDEPISDDDPRKEAPEDTEPRTEDEQHDDMEPVEEAAFSKDWWANQLLTDIEYSADPLDTRILLQCGGAAGHMSHPFDDWELTFKDFKNIINFGLSGQLNREDNVSEKMDGQNIMVSWRDGKLISARNKGHIKNAGKNALDVKGIMSKFKDRGDIRDAFVFAVKDLQSAISKLSDKQRQKIFMEGKAFMNLEIMWPKSANVIDYDIVALVFHGAIEYNDEGTPIGIVKGSARILEGMIRQINQHIQKHFKIEKPRFLDIPKHQDFGKRKKYYFNKLQKLQKQYALNDNDSFGLYHQRFWEEFIYNSAKQHKYKIPYNVLVGLTKRWAFFDKSYKIPRLKKDVDNEKFLDWALTFNKTDHEKYVKQNMFPFETLFFELGADILKNVSGFIASNPDKAVQKMKQQLDKVVTDIRAGGDISKIQKMKTQLEKLQAIGGAEAIVPTEGLVFKYKGNMYKFTGTFAPINQLLGMLKFSGR